MKSVSIPSVRWSKTTSVRVACSTSSPGSRASSTRSKCSRRRRSMALLELLEQDGVVGNRRVGRRECGASGRDCPFGAIRPRLDRHRPESGRHGADDCDAPGPCPSGVRHQDIPNRNRDASARRGVDHRSWPGASSPPCRSPSSARSARWLSPSSVCRRPRSFAVAGAEPSPPPEYRGRSPGWSIPPGSGPTSRT